MQPDNATAIINNYHSINWQAIMQSSNWGIPIVFLLLILFIVIIKYNNRQKAFYIIEEQRYKQLEKRNEVLFSYFKDMRKESENNVCKFDLSPQSIPTVIPSSLPTKSSSIQTPTNTMDTSFFVEKEKRIDEEKNEEDVEITPIFFPKTPVVPPMFITDDEISSSIDRMEVIGRKKK